MTFCHATRPIPGGGVNLCTRPRDHGTNHLDGIHNVSWPVTALVTGPAILDVIPRVGEVVTIDGSRSTVLDVEKNWSPAGRPLVIVTLDSWPTPLVRHWARP